MAEHASETRFQAAVANIARFADFDGTPGLAEKVLADGGASAWCYLATRVDVPATTALTAVKKLVPNKSTDLRYRPGSPSWMLPTALMRRLLQETRSCSDRTALLERRQLGSR
jgi:hypothetical protein